MVCVLCAVLSATVWCVYCVLCSVRLYGVCTVCCVECDCMVCVLCAVLSVTKLDFFLQETSRCVYGTLMKSNDICIPSDTNIQYFIVILLLVTTKVCLINFASTEIENERENII